MAEIIAVASGKGGVGKSTCVAGIACGLKNRGKRVLALDLDVGLRSLDIIFGVREKVVNNWGDIILSRCEADNAFTDCDGIKLLSAPMEFENEFTPEKLSEVLSQWDEDFDFILLDAPAGIGKYFSLACNCAKRGIVVSNPEDVCVRSACVAAEKMRDAGIDDVRLIINKFIRKFTLKKKHLNIDGVIDETAVQLLGIVEFDDNISLVSMENKSFNLKSKPQRSFDRIAGRLCGEKIPLKI